MPQDDLPQFARAVRGYDRAQVDDYVRRLTADLAEAHARAVTAERADGGGTAGDRPGAGAAVEPAPLPLAGLAPGADRGRSGGSRVAVAGAVLALCAGAGAVALTGADDAVAPVASETPSITRSTTAMSLPAAATTVSEMGDAAGTASRALLGALRQLDALTGIARQARALSLARDVEVAIAGGELTPAVGRAVLPSLTREATPVDVPALADVLEVRPDVAGTDGPEVLQLLRALGPIPRPEAAAEVLEVVRTGPDRGVLTASFRDVAVPVLADAAER